MTKINIKALNDLKKIVDEAKHQQIVRSLQEEEATSHAEDSHVEQIAKYLSAPKNRNEVVSSNGFIQESSLPVGESIEGQRWNDPLRKEPGEKFVTIKELNDHYSLFLQRIQQQLSSVGGGGEVNFRYLDDVNRFTMLDGNDNHILEYDATSGKAQFTNRIGPIDRIMFDINHAHDEIKTPGTLCWSNADKTINIEHPGGVTQQVGQELYVKVRNRTGSTIPNSSAVRFDGAEQNGTSRLLVAPFIANGAFPSLYGLGITTQDILDGEDGFVTVWGKIRDLNTSSWNVGDILYVSPSVAGGLTNVKPTAPNNVIPIAAVLSDDVNEGEIFVRPTIEQQKYYGRFARTTNLTAVIENTAYPIGFDDTEISNGVSIGTPDSRVYVVQSGFYQFDVSIQAEAISNKGIVYLWFRKGNASGSIDVPKSSRSSTVNNGDSFTISSTLQISLNANEYVEVVYASSVAGMLLRANPTPAIGPSVVSALLSVAQIQL